MSAPGPDMFTTPYSLTKTYHRVIYPAVDPTTQHSVPPESSGIAKAWSTAGALGIVLVGRNRSSLEQTAQHLGSTTKSLIVVGDMTSDADVARVVKTAFEEFGHVDVLINNAGTMTDAPIATTGVETWFRDFESNVKGTYNMIHHFILATNGTGTIINIVSLGAALMVPVTSPYSGSKLAAIRLGESIHAEMPNLRVFSFHPGVVEVKEGRGMMAPLLIPFAKDKALLSGGVSLYLSSPKAEFLRGTYLSMNWDVEEIEAHRGEIVEKGLMKLGFLKGMAGDGVVEEGKGEGYKWAEVGE